MLLPLALPPVPLPPASALPHALAAARLRLLAPSVLHTYAGWVDEYAEALFAHLHAQEPAPLASALMQTGAALAAAGVQWQVGSATLTASTFRDECVMALWALVWQHLHQLAAWAAELVSSGSTSADRWKRVLQHYRNALGRCMVVEGVADSQEPLLSNSLVQLTACTVRALLQLAVVAKMAVVHRLGQSTLAGVVARVCVYVLEQVQEALQLVEAQPALAPYREFWQRARDYSRAHTALWMARERHGAGEVGYALALARFGLVQLERHRNAHDEPGKLRGLLEKQSAKRAEKRAAKHSAFLNADYFKVLTGPPGALAADLPLLYSDLATLASTLQHENDTIGFQTVMLPEQVLASLAAWPAGRPLPVGETAWVPGCLAGSTPKPGYALQGAYY